MVASFVVVVRNTTGGNFGNEPGPTKYLAVPDGDQISIDQSLSRTKWIEAVVDDACFAHDDVADERIGSVLFYVHGFNNTQETVLERHRLLLASLRDAGYQGTVVSFDWPSASTAINYLEDRSDAKATADRLVRDCITPFARIQRPECQINLNIIAHSMGAFVVREAMDDADDRRSLAATSWTVSQTVFIAADVSSSSLKRNDSKSSSLYRRTVRLTNYFSGHDSVLSLSNVKRIGVAPRAGRIGLPEEIPANAVDVDCSDRWKEIEDNHSESFANHSWYIGDKEFTRDLLLTLQGELDRHAFPTRERIGPSRFLLKKGT